MEILRTISIFASERKIRFLVIGGHAVNSYGVSRHTGDLDLLVPLTDKSIWLELMEKLRYSVGQSDNRFARFKPVNLDNWPIDFMYVDETTFEGMYAQSQLHDFGNIDARVIHPKHLVLLKLHALKHFQVHRHAKDYSDLISLLKLPDVKFEREELEAACKKYADVELYDKIIKDLE